VRERVQRAVMPLGPGGPAAVELLFRRPGKAAAPEAAAAGAAAGEGAAAADAAAASGASAQSAALAVQQLQVRGKRAASARALS